jgi:hypothetical protein
MKIEGGTETKSHRFQRIPAEKTKDGSSTTRFRLNESLSTTDQAPDSVSGNFNVSIRNVSYFFWCCLVHSWRACSQVS